MKYEDIKPIPKTIERRIRKLDLELHPQQEVQRRFYAYLTKNDGDLAKVTVAVKNHKGKWYCKQVAIHGVHADICFVKDFMYCRIGGYCVGWYAEGLQTKQKWYEFDDWGWCHDSELDPYAPVINTEFIGRFAKYKYSGYQFFKRSNVIEYIRLYEQHPLIVEQLVKMGLDHLITRPQIIAKVEKDKHFRKWLSMHREELKDSNVYLSSIFTAYKTGKPVAEVFAYDTAKKVISSKSYQDLRQAFDGEVEQLCRYIARQHTSVSTYNDYYTACTYLHLDMSLEKNRYPHDFMRWHDIRTDEYASAMDEEDAKKRKEFYAQFAVVAEKYQSLQYDRTDRYICIIAHSPKELKREGEFLQHCVGRMGYDKKMVREETLIFFVRQRAEPEKPFVTVEYSLSQRRVLQCYGYKDQRPNEHVLDYVNRVWLPHANNKINKIAA